MTVAEPERTSTLVIGGGPAGIVSLKYLLEYGPAWSAGEDPMLVEMESEIGGTFRQVECWRSYDTAELVSSKQLTCFSDFRYPLDAPDHPSLPNYVEYLGSYSKHFKLTPHICTSTKLVSLRTTGPASHPHRAVLRTLTRGSDEGSEREILATRVIITTGLHVTPNIPSIPGLTSPLAEGASAAKTSPHWLHSSDYKSPSQLQGKKVMILGAGETGMDVAYDAVLAPATQVWMAVRTGFLSFPKVLNHFRVLGTTFDGNLPIDGLITNLFETAYVHPWVAQTHLRWFVSDFVIRRLMWVLTGTMAGCNQWAGELEPGRQGRAYVFLNKSAKAMRFINKPFYRLSWFHRLLAHYQDPPLPPGKEHLADRKIDMIPFPRAFDSDGKAVFNPPPPHRRKEIAWTTDVRPEVVVLCTGYRQEWDWLGEDYPRGPDECDVRTVCSSSDPSVGFIGFLRPGVGAIPPMAEMQIQLFLLITQGEIPIPTSPETYHLLHKPEGRIQYGVDYSTYMSTLAKDMGSAPGLRQLWREHGWFVLFVYCFGAAFPTFYRLTGPYKSPVAPEIVRTELWDTIRRRGWIGNLVMGVIPMAFYAIINLVAYLAEGVWTLLPSAMRAQIASNASTGRSDPSRAGKTR